MRSKVYVILNALGLLLTIVINYLQNTGVFGGNTMKTISDAYFNRFTPAGYAFSIWGLIYLGLACFVVYTALAVFRGKDPQQAVARVGWWFLLSCMANSLWVIAWLCDYTLASVGIMLVLLISLLAIVKRLDLSLARASTRNYLFVSIPFSLYAGWISLAIIANIAALLTKLQWGGLGLSAVGWTIGMIVVAGLLNLYMVLGRNMRAYGAVGIWGLLAVAANQDVAGGHLVVQCCYTVSGLILLAVLFNCFKPVPLKPSAGH